ncbi:putative GTP-binding protein 6 isoform X2 [Athalia rosae]|nr:putative GTP-binding protein 6 isoform X2 [Athalia rosae]
MFAIRKLSQITKNCVIRLSSPRKESCLALQFLTSRSKHNGILKDDDLRDEEYENLSSEYLGLSSGGHNALVLQPYIKWGPDKKTNTTPELQLEEAVTLLKTLPNWSVVDKMCVSLMTLEKSKLLGIGNLESLKKRVRSNKVTAVFVSTDLLKPIQMQELEHALRVPVYDRYSIVVQIFRAHAKSQEAKLQVAIAEIPYMWTKLNLIKDNRTAQVGLVECRRKLLMGREAKLKNALKKLKAQRELLRSKRKTHKIPTVAVVGYTNAGKTSLIKALTGDKTLEPKNCLFATLDVTLHRGELPSRLKVLFVDTIGFIQDVPSTLIEPFIATLEDAINADVILHVNDATHPDRRAQMEHVDETIKSLIKDQPVINVANKIDLLKEDNPPVGMLGVSATQLTGIDILREQIDKELLKATGRSVIRMRVQAGSQAAAWLYKETAVTNVEADPKNAQ